MRNQRGFTLPELVVGLSIIATVALIVSTMIFSGFSMVNKNSADLYMGSYLKKDYSEMRKEIKEAKVLCVKGAEAFANPASVMCGNPSSDTELDTDQVLYLVNSSNQQVYYKFENSGLYRYDKTNATSEVFMANVTGSFKYNTANLLTLDLTFRTKDLAPMLEFSTFYISINQ